MVESSSPRTLKQNTQLEVDYRDGAISVVLQRKEDALAMLETISKSGLDWSDLSMQRESLEDVFVKLVGSRIEDEGETVKVK